MAKLLVLYDDATHDFEVVTTQDAIAVAVPTWRMVAATPPVGSVVGEAIINTTTKQAFVWDGNKWDDITPAAIRQVANDALLTSTPPAPGQPEYAMAMDTGNLYMHAAGAGWRIVGIRTYNTVASLFADRPADGAIGYATDTRDIWYRSGGVWVPGNFHSGTEAGIRAMASRGNQVAFTTDTHKIFFGDGSGGWDELPWATYDTEAHMAADTPVDGTLAVAKDTAHVGFFTGGHWTFINVSAIAESKLSTVGEIKQSFLTEAQFNAQMPPAERGKWIPCDGRDITGSVLAGILGRTEIWDLRGAYFRMTGTNATNSAWDGGTLNTYQEDRTAPAKNHFVGAAAAGGNHTHTYRSGHGDNHGIKGGDFNPGEIGWEDIQNTTGEAPGHTHIVSIQGGDAETRPKTFIVNYFVKINN